MEEIKVLIVNRLEKIKSKLEALAEKRETFKDTSIIACAHVSSCIISLGLSIPEESKHNNLMYTAGFIQGLLMLDNNVLPSLYQEICELLGEANQLWMDAKN